MTDFTDEELIKIREDIEKELRIYCYVRPWILARLIKDYYMQWGIKRTVTSCLRRIRGFITFTNAEDPNILKMRTSSVDNVKVSSLQV